MSTFADSWGTWDHPHVIDGPPITGDGGGQISYGPAASQPRGIQSPLEPAGIGPIVTRVPSQTIDPTTGQPSSVGQTAQPAASGGFDLSSLLNAQVFGIPVLWIGIAAAVYFLFIKKGR